MTKAAAFVQARMGSSRFPGKVLEPILGKPLLAWIVERLSAADQLDEVVVLTSELPADEPVRRLAESSGWPLFSGSEDDVLDRFQGAAREFTPEVIVRVT